MAFDQPQPTGWSSPFGWRSATAATKRKFEPNDKIGNEHVSTGRMHFPPSWNNKLQNGIILGASLSVLLFILPGNPLSYLLQKLKACRLGKLWKSLYQGNALVFYGRAVCTKSNGNYAPTGFSNNLLQGHGIRSGQMRICDCQTWESNWSTESLNISACPCQPLLTPGARDV